MAGATDRKSVAPAVFPSLVEGLPPPSSSPAPRATSSPYIRYRRRLTPADPFSHFITFHIRNEMKRNEMKRYVRVES